MKGEAAMIHRRKLFVLEASESPELRAKLEGLEFSSIKPTEVSPSLELEGGVLLIPLSSWYDGFLSELTRYSDLSFVALHGPNESPDRVKFWYMLGASLVLDENSSAAVLRGALERLLDIEIESLQPGLTRKENLLFETLRRAGDLGLDRSTLASRIWDKISVQEKTIDVHIFNLRRKLNSTRFRVVCRDHRFFLEDVSAHAPVPTSSLRVGSSDASAARKLD